MRKSIVLALVPLMLTFGIAQAPAASTSLTQDQVNTVCGGDKKEYLDGTSGCAKPCGYPEANKTCVYTCYEKTGKCDGFVAKQGAAVRPGHVLGGGAVLDPSPAPSLGGGKFAPRAPTGGVLTPQ